MVNKKGFIRILESIIAIVVVFGSIVLLISSSSTTTESETPYQLKMTVDNIVKQVQNQPELRKQVLYSESPKAIEDLDAYISSTLTTNTPLSYAFSITFDEDIKYYSQGSSSSKERSEVIPLEVNVYVKKVFITVDDVTSSIDDEYMTEDRFGRESGLEPNEFTTFTIYMWYNVD